MHRIEKLFQFYSNVMHFLIDFQYQCITVNLFLVCFLAVFTTTVVTDSMAQMLSIKLKSYQV